MPHLNECVHQRERNKLSRNLSKEVSVSAANMGKYAERRQLNIIVLVQSNGAECFPQCTKCTFQNL